jgi:hypothetical protein
MKMPLPSDAHRRLERLVGVWRGEETLHPSSFDPAGGTATATVKNVVAIDGFAVVQDYEQKRADGSTFRGHGIFRYDADGPPGRQYVMHWFDSLGLPPSEFRGSFEGDVFTVGQALPHGQLRAVWDLSNAKRYTYRMEVSMDGVSWAPFMEGRYTREG